MHELPNFNKAFSQILRSRREQIHMTQMRLAIEIGGSEVAVRRMERGSQTPTVTTLILLARALGVEPDKFLAEIVHQIAFLDSRQDGSEDQR